jgi:hypothetical protein
MIIFGNNWTDTYIFRPKALKIGPMDALETIGPGIAIEDSNLSLLPVLDLLSI